MCRTSASRSSSARPYCHGQCGSWTCQTPGTSVACIWRCGIEDGSRRIAPLPAAEKTVDGPVEGRARVQVHQVAGGRDADLPGAWNAFDEQPRHILDVRLVLLADDDEDGTLQVRESLDCRRV